MPLQATSSFNGGTSTVHKATLLGSAGSAAAAVVKIWAFDYDVEDMAKEAVRHWAVYQQLPGRVVRMYGTTCVRLLRGGRLHQVPALVMEEATGGSLWDMIMGLAAQVGGQAPEAGSKPGVCLGLCQPGRAI